MIYSSASLLIAGLSLIVSANACAKDEIDLSKDPEAQQTLKIFNYGLLKGVGFTEVGDSTAYTLLYRNREDKAPRIYYASIRSKAEGPYLFFAASEPCIEGQFNHNEIIEINNQNVQAISGCKRDAGNTLTLGFSLKTVEGNQFALEEFKANKVVLVRFRAMRIPFVSEDFPEALKKFSQRPL